MYIYTGLGQVGTFEEIKQATDRHAQMLASGALIKTKYLGQGTNEYAFDPKEPDIIYALTPNMGNGPGGTGWPCFSSTLAGSPAKYKYCGGPPVPWVGEIDVNQWLATQSPSVQQLVKTKLGMASSEEYADSTSSSQKDTDVAIPGLGPVSQTNLMIYGGGALVFLMLGLGIFLRSRGDDSDDSDDSED